MRDGKCVSIDEVERGLGCGCTCAACGHRLIAKKGKIRTAHFAHAAKSDCERMGETHLHLAAKQILMDRKEILLPDFRGREYLTTSITSSPMHKDLYQHAKETVTKGEIVLMDNIREEEGLDGIRPDIIFEKGGRELLVEIRVTHATEKEKIRDIRKRKLPCIEIDLSRTPRDKSLQELEHIVIGDGPEPAPRTWLSHPKGERKAALRSTARKEEFVRRIRAARSKLTVRGAYGGIGSDVVDHCPVNVYQGRHQIRIIDCIYCEHHVAYFGPEDEELHGELTGRDDFDVVYTNCIPKVVLTPRGNRRKYYPKRF
ncbi:MAG: competence protein CoiA family protein [Paracoccaceae bacterium]|nr:competence protein CoiA family protein [Paracoccaceae bacterium]